MKTFQPECTRFLLPVAFVAAALPAAAQDRDASVSQRVVVVGCLAKNGEVDPDRGTRQLNTAANGYVLTNARMTAASRAGGSAVPGSTPSGGGTGTIPRDTIVGRDAGASPAQPLGFALAGGDLQALAALVGQRVEVVGTIPPPAASRTDAAPRGTSGTGREVQPDRGTREERTGQESAHPSADLQPLNVVSFRGVTGGCQ